MTYTLYNPLTTFSYHAIRSLLRAATHQKDVLAILPIAVCGQYHGS